MTIPPPDLVEISKEVASEVFPDFDSLDAVFEEFGSEIAEAAERFAQDRDWTSVFVTCGRAYGPELLAVLIANKLVHMEELPSLLASVWTAVELPSNTSTDWWVAMFRETGFISDTDEMAPPFEPIRLYRGSRNESQPGMVWTANVSTARWFSNRFPPSQEDEHLMEGSEDALKPTYDHHGTLKTTVAEPSQILAIFNQQGEQEYVLDPGGLRYTYLTVP